MSKTILNNKILAKKYMTALYEQASTEKIIEKIWQDLQFLAHLLNQDSKANKIILNCNIPEDKKLALLKIILDNSKFSDLTERFLALLIKNNRFYILPEIIKCYKIRLQKDNNELQAYIYSSAILKKPQLDDITKVLETKFGKNISADNIVDKKILGGFLVKIGSKMIDCSLAKKLQIFESESKKLITLK